MDRFELPLYEYCREINRQWLGPSLRAKFTRVPRANMFLATDALNASYSMMICVPCHSSKVYVVPSSFLQMVLLGKIE